MKLYKLTFKPLAALSKIPDAQTIFGAICAIIKYTQGEDALAAYLQSFEHEPLFVHSSMYVEDLLPMAKVGLLTLHEKNQNVFALPPSEQLKYATDLKKYKGLKYVSLKVYEDFLLNGDFDGLRKAIDAKQIYTNEELVTDQKETLTMSHQLLVHNRQSINSDGDKDLFYDQNLYLSSNVCIYVKTNDIDYVTSIVRYFAYIGIGNRVSTGKNCFELINVEELTPFNHQSDYRLLLSKCISDEFILDESSYMIDSHIYGGSKYYSSNKIGRINKFVEGSYMKVRNDQEYYGRVIKVNNGKDIYHYGIGFVL